MVGGSGCKYCGGPVQARGQYVPKKCGKCREGTGICRTCGKRFKKPHGKSIWCSQECKDQSEYGKRSAVPVPCEACGKIVLKRASRLEIGAKSFCSNKCQGSVQGNNNSHLSRDIDWDVRSAKAKILWKARRSRERYRIRYSKFAAALSRLNAKVRTRQQKDPLVAKMEYRLSSSLVRARKVEKKRVDANKAGIHEAIIRLNAATKWQSMDSVQRKMINKLSNLTKRRRRKDGNENTEGAGGCISQQIQGGQRQMCFKWMADR